MVREAMMRHKAVYLAAVGGAGALLAQHIVAAEVAAYEDLGPEAILRLTVDGFPAVVINDIYGGDAYETGQARFRRACPVDPALRAGLDPSSDAPRTAGINRSSSRWMWRIMSCSRSRSARFRASHSVPASDGGW